MAPGSNVLCTLPMAHMYGMMVEFFLNFCLGNHIFFLTRLPSPSLIQSACADIHPAIVIVVPMVIEKIIRKMVFPLIQQRYVHLLLNMPVVNKKIKARILQQVKDIFGGQLFEMMFGGAGAQPRGRGLPPPYRISPGRGLRHDRDGPAHHLQRLPRLRARHLRTGGGQHGDTHRQSRPSQRAGRDPHARLERHAGLLQESRGQPRRARQGRMVSHRRPRHHRR